MSWRNAPGEEQTERDRMPYLQIDTNTWVCVRESLEHPRAVIRRITARDQTEKYFLFTWHPDPSKQRMHAIYDTLEEANREVRWNNKLPVHPRQPS